MILCSKLRFNRCLATLQAQHATIGYPTVFPWQNLTLNMLNVIKLPLIDLKSGCINQCRIFSVMCIFYARLLFDIREQMRKTVQADCVCVCSSSSRLRSRCTYHHNTVLADLAVSACSTSIARKMNLQETK